MLRQTEYRELPGLSSPQGPSSGKHLHEAVLLRATLGKAKLISPSEQVFRWIVFAQMKARDFPLLRLFS